MSGPDSAVLFDSTTIPFTIREATANLDEAPQPGPGVALWIDCDNVEKWALAATILGSTMAFVDGSVVNVVLWP